MHQKSVKIELASVPQIREKVTHPKNGQNGGFAARSIAHNNQMVSINVSHDLLEVDCLDLQLKLIGTSFSAVNVHNSA